MQYSTFTVAVSCQQTFTYIISWFNYNVMDVVNVVMFYLVSIFDTTKE